MLKETAVCGRQNNHQIVRLLAHNVSVVVGCNRVPFFRDVYQEAMSHYPLRPRVQHSLDCLKQVDVNWCAKSSFCEVNLRLSQPTYTTPEYLIPRVPLKFSVSALWRAVCWHPLAMDGHDTWCALLPSLNVKTRTQQSDNPFSVKATKRVCEGCLFHNHHYDR